jgi:hypothetical protein
MTENIPSGPGRLHISHWSNGNPGWSAGSPQNDAVLTVSYVKAYFNSSDPGIPQAALKSCPVDPASMVAAVLACDIPDGKKEGGGGGGGGGGPGPTTFLTNDTDGQTHSSLAVTQRVVVSAPLGAIYAVAMMGMVFVWFY